MSDNSRVDGRRPATGARAFALPLVLLAALSLPGPANADVVTDWNAIAEAVAPRFGGPQQQSRVLAIAQIAVHDALNAIKPRYARYTEFGRADRGASPDAAVAAASRLTLLELLVPVPDSPEKQAAIQTIETAYLATVASAVSTVAQSGHGSVSGSSGSSGEAGPAFWVSTFSTSTQ
jgi:hypothetical protein